MKFEKLSLSTAEINNLMSLLLQVVLDGRDLPLSVIEEEFDNQFGPMPEEIKRHFIALVSTARANH